MENACIKQKYQQHESKLAYFSDTKCIGFLYIVNMHMFKCVVSLKVKVNILVFSLYTHAHAAHISRSGASRIPVTLFGTISFKFGSLCREHAQCAACCLQSVEQLSRVWNSNMAEAVVSLPLTNLEWFQIASSRA